MGINNRYIEKYDIAYKDLKTITSPIYFLESSPYYHQEEWRDISSIFIPGVLDNTYKISNIGRVWTNLNSRAYPNGGFMNHVIDNKGYHRVRLSFIDKRNRDCSVTRLMMLHFRFREGCQRFEVDHLDGNKDNNVLWNLEWVTPQENTHRAIINGQRDLSVRKSGGTLLTNEQAYALYDEAMNHKDYDELVLKYNVSKDYIHKLVEGVIRPYIAGKYYNRLHI